MIQFETKYHEKVENSSYYKAIREITQDTLDQHLCAGDESQSFDEKTDGIGVYGKEEAAMFIAQFIHKKLKEAWEDGWRVRDKSCGKSRADIMLKKKTDWEAFKSSLMNEISKMNSETTDERSDATEAK